MIDNLKNNRKYVKIMKRRLTGKLWWLSVAFTLSLLWLTGPGQAGEVKEANPGKGGETLEIKSLPVRGQITVVEFYSPFCPPCVRLAPMMEKLCQRRPEITVKKVNINRPEVQRIDWNSPLARQYRLRSVPYFAIFNPRGKLVAEGEAAMRQVGDWLREAKIIEE
jgi:thiol-disulfide isomerase/thioredoxin